MQPIARLIKAQKRYSSGDSVITALDETSLDIQNGQVLLIVGPSGSGKTTLLSMLGCVIYPTEGSVVIDNVETGKLSQRDMAYLRAEKIGFVFQTINLISPLTAEENVLYPLSLLGITGKTAREKALEALALVGMTDKRRSLPRELSGGQQQRVAIARALVANPVMLLCDEPTASLDIRSVEIVMKELRGLADQGKTVVIVTHDYRLEQYADQIIVVENGRVVRQYPSRTPSQ